MYPNAFGGVTVVSKKVFLDVNGYSNLYFGWGGEGIYRFDYFTHRLK